MRIVLITHYYPPEVNAPALRAHDHAHLWSEAGHDVTIVTAQPSHPYGKLYESYRNDTSVQIDRKVRVLRLKTILGANAGFVKRLTNYLSFMVAVWAGARKIPQADVVISTSPQIFCGIAGKYVASVMKCAWILEIRDVWPDSIVAVGASRPGIATRVLSRLVKYAYKRADHIVSVSPGFADHFNQQNVPPDKINVIPNGISADTTPITCKREEFPDLVPLAGKKIISYFGTLGMAHGLSTILSAAELLKDNQNVGFLIAGSGAERDRLARELVDRKLDNVVILGQQDQQAIHKLFYLSYANLVHLKNQNVFESVIPTKLLEGMAMGKPMLLGVKGVAKSILDDAEAGISFEPENAQAMANAISEILEDPQMAERLGRAGRVYIQRNFRREKMAENYLDLLRYSINCKLG